MSQSFEVKAERREGNGTGDSRRMRKAGNIPAVVYGGDADPMGIVIKHHEILKSLENEAFYSHVLSLDVDGKKQDVLLKDVHRHPNGPHILHVDFQRVGANTKIKKSVPIHFIGESACVGVKAGGQLSHSMNSVEVVCLVKDLPEYIEVDVANLDIGETFHLTDIKLPEGVQVAELMHGSDHDLSVAVVQKARGAAADDDEAPSEEAPSEE